MDDGQDLQRHVADCFSHNHLVFAGHARDEECAFSLLQYCRQHRIGWVDLRREFETYLRSAGAWQFDIDAQMVRVEAAMRPWLPD